MAGSSEILTRVRRLGQKMSSLPLPRNRVAPALLLACQILVCLAGLMFTYASGNQNQNTAHVESALKSTIVPSRILHFPPHRSMGRLMIPVKGPKESGETEWEYYSDARGEVSVPEDQKLYLIIGSKSLNDLSALSRLGKNDLYKLTIYGSRSSDVNPGDTAVKHIRGLTGLKELTLNRINISSIGLRQIRNFRSLKMLYVLSDQLGDRGLAEIGKMKSLEKLDFYGKNISDNGLSYLAGLTSLKEIGLTYQPGIRGPGFASIAKLPSLEQLYLGGLKFDNETLRYLSGASSLKRIHLGRKLPVNDKGLEYLSPLTRLEELSLFDNPITDAGMIHLRNMHSLRNLNLGWTDVTDAGLIHLKNLRLLESLTISHHISDKGLAYIAELPDLKHLSVSDDRKNKITDHGLEMLSKRKSLESLSIQGRGITDAGISRLVELKKLKHLSLQGSPLLTDKCMKSLTQLKSLSHLELLSDNITVSGLNQLNSLPGLKKLDVRNITQDCSGLDLSGLKNLEIITLITGKNSASLSDEDMAWLSHLKKVKWLQGIRGHIGDEGMARLAGLTSMERLNIQGSEMTDLSLSYLSNMKKLNNLTILGNFTDKGMRHLEGLTSLNHVVVYSSEDISENALSRLRQKLPKLYTLRVDKKRDIKGVKKRPGKGVPAPPFVIETLDGKEIKLGDCRGKVTLLYFWATWCTPCLASTPNLKILNGLLGKNPDFLMISLSMDNDESKLRKYIKEKGLSWPQARIGVHSKVASDYGVKAAPTYILIDKNGKVLLDTERNLEIIKKTAEKALAAIR